MYYKGHFYDDECGTDTIDAKSGTLLALQDARISWDEIEGMSIRELHSRGMIGDDQIEVWRDVWWEDQDPLNYVIVRPATPIS